MARQHARLSAAAVRASTDPGRYPDGGGLYLLVGPTGAKSWVFRFALGGVRTDMGLGPLHTVSLAEARAAALDCRRQLLSGINPKQARDSRNRENALAAAKSVTFSKAAARYIEAHAAGWKSEKHAKQWSATLTTHAAALGELPVSVIDTSAIISVLQPIWATIPETASRVRGRIEAILDWATTAGLREGPNPARWRGHLSNMLPSAKRVRKVEHHAALPYRDLPSFWVRLEESDSTASRALRLSILTACRTAEVLGAMWSDIDFAEKVWTIPAAKMKAGRPHRVPLSEAACRILKSQKQVILGDYVFPGGKPKSPLSNMALLMLLRRMGRDDLTAHGFRSTFRDWCSEETPYPSEVAEMALAHVVSDKVEAAYRRGDLLQKRRSCMEDWAIFCCREVVRRSQIPAIGD